MILLNGDCLVELKKLPDNSVDSLVTDPPAGISFMGKDWDSDKGGRNGWIKWMSEVMTETKRVMKPGAYGLVWAIPRTSHWTATALEDAGFEVRDVITHLFGSGFPKSLNISKAIDKAAGAERDIIQTIKKTPSASKCHEGWERPWAEGKTTMDITAPATDEAKQWQGWGTALKPASEHWVLVRKPLEEKTVSANVLKHGCGGINIDASRIEASNRRSPLGADGLVHRTNGNSYGKHKQSTFNINQGRFPANLVLSHSPYCQNDQCDIECAIVKLDEQSGILKQGGASRFFYCAKISSSERNAGAVNSHPTVKPKKLMSYFIKMITPPNGTVLDPFMGSGSTGIAAIETGFKFIGIEKEPDYFEIAKGRIFGTKDNTST